MSEERPLTRRELRLKRLAEQEASRGDVQPAAAPTSPERVLTRKELRALRLQSAAETGSLPAVREEHGVRRRPVVAPQTTGNVPLVDPQTGTIAAVEVPVVLPDDAAPVPPQEFRVPEPAAKTQPEAAASEGPGSAPEPAAPTSSSVVRAPSFDELLTGHEEPEAEPVAGAPRWRPVDHDLPAVVVDSSVAPPQNVPQRTSLLERAAEKQSTPETHDDPDLTVEQAALRAPSAGMTVLRYVILIIAMFLVGGLIWIVAQRASANPIDAAFGAVLERMIA